MKEFKKTFLYEGRKFLFIKPNLRYRFQANVFNDKLDEFIENFTYRDKLNFTNSLKDLEAKVMKEDTNFQTFVIDVKESLEKGNYKDLNELIKEIQDYILDAVMNYPEELNQFMTDYNVYLERRKTGIEIFFQNVKNAKELFELCLIPQLTRKEKFKKYFLFQKNIKPAEINYELIDAKKVIAFDKFLEEVRTSFFLSRMQFKKESQQYKRSFPNL